MNVRRLISIGCLAVAVTTWHAPVMAQAKTVERLLAEAQFDLAQEGTQFLREQVQRASFVMLGGLYGDNESQDLLLSLQGYMGAGPLLVIKEMSPWAAEREFGGVPGARGVRIRGVDVEQDLVPLIRDFAAVNPDNPAVQTMAALVARGYRREDAGNLLMLARRAGDTKTMTGGVPLSQIVVRSMEVEVDWTRLDTADLPASEHRARVMKDFFLAHYRQFAATDGKPKVAALLGRDLLTRGKDRQGVATLGNFLSEFAVAEGVDSFNVGVFAAGGEVSRGDTQPFDERPDDPAFAYMADAAQAPATIFDMRPLRQPLRLIPAQSRTPAQASLLYWADAYDAIIYYRKVTPIAAR